MLCPYLVPVTDGKLQVSGKFADVKEIIGGSLKMSSKNWEQNLMTSENI